MTIRYIRIADDLHLEWQRDRSKHVELIPYDMLDPESVLVLAGDIGAGTRLEEFLKTMCHRFPYVFYVPGNHEYYNCKSYEKQNEWLRSLEDRLFNLGVAAGDVLELAVDDIHLIGTTMWTDCNHGDPGTMLAVERGLNDFTVIPDWTVERMINVHTVQKQQIVDLLRVPNGKKKIVVTHHTPSMRLAAGRFAGHPANPGFHANCDDILDSKDAPFMWVFGHTHDKMAKYVGKTLCVNNPYGYPNEHSNADYDRHCFWDISKDRPEQA